MNNRQAKCTKVHLMVYIVSDSLLEWQVLFSRTAATWSTIISFIGLLPSFQIKERCVICGASYNHLPSDTVCIPYSVGRIEEPICYSWRSTRRWLVKRRLTITKCPHATQQHHKQSPLHYNWFNIGHYLIHLYYALQSSSQACPVIPFQEHCFQQTMT